MRIPQAGTGHKLLQSIGAILGVLFQERGYQPNQFTKVMLGRRHDLDHRHDSTAARIALVFNLRLNNWYLIADVMALNIVATSPL